MTQNRITHFCLPSFRCLAVICHSFSYIFLAAHPSRSYVIMHAQQISACAWSSPPLVTFYIPDWRYRCQLLLLYFSLPSPSFHIAGFVSVFLHSPRPSRCYECEEMFVSPVIRAVANITKNRQSWLFFIFAINLSILSTKLYKTPII